MVKLEFGAMLDVNPYFGRLANYRKTEEYVLKCEELGYDSVFVCDHLVWEPKGSILECWTTLSALAAVTKKVMLGNLVTSNVFRLPSVLAKMAANVDLISNGRLVLGIGAGNNHLGECEAYGIPFPEPQVRVRMLREAVIIIKKMWTEEKSSFKGKYYQIQDAVCEPKPVQKPHPPIMIGGAGEQLTLRVVAEQADICNFFGSPELYKNKLDVLKKHCEIVGRDFNEITKSVSTHLYIARNKEELDKQLENSPFMHHGRFDTERNLIGTPDEIIKKIQAYIDIGVTSFNGTHMVSGLISDAELFYDKVVKAFK